MNYKIIIGILLILILFSFGCTQATGEAKKIIKENNTPTLFNKQNPLGQNNQNTTQNNNELGENNQNNQQHAQKPSNGIHSTTYCIETDYKDDPLIKGTTTIKINGQPVQIKTDTCVTQNKLKEYYCKNNSSSTISEKIINCECENGACANLTTCYTCQDCTQKIQKLPAGATIKLNNPILFTRNQLNQQEKACILINKNPIQEITLDCQNNEIKPAPNAFNENEYTSAITLKNSNHIKIQNCKTKKTIIKLQNSNHNTLNNIQTQNTIDLSGYYDIGSITLNNSQYNTIKNTTTKNNRIGIKLENKSNHNILNNTTNNQNLHGIRLDNSNYNTIKNTKNNQNQWDGIQLEKSNHNTIIDTNNNQNQMSGIVLGHSNYNQIQNTQNNNNHTSGIQIYSSSHNTINHTLNNNTFSDGITILLSHYNQIQNTKNTNNNIGISLSFSSYNTTQITLQ